MDQWNKINFYVILGLCTITGIKYLSEYIDLLNDKFVPDAIRIFLFAVPVAICCLVLLIVSANKKKYKSLILDLVVGFSQLLIIGLRGKNIPLYGMFMSASFILLLLVIFTVYWISKKKKPVKYSVSRPSKSQF